MLSAKAPASRKSGGLMCTSASLNACVDEAVRLAAHLYWECLLPDHVPGPPHAYGVREVSLDTPAMGSEVTAAIPRARRNIEALFVKTA